MLKNEALQNKKLQKSAITVNNKTINIQHEGGKCENCVWREHYCENMATPNLLQISTLAKNVEISIKVVTCDYFLPNSIDRETDDEQINPERKKRSVVERRAQIKEKGNSLVRV